MKQKISPQAVKMAWLRSKHGADSAQLLSIRSLTRTIVEDVLPFHICENRAKACSEPSEPCHRYILVLLCYLRNILPFLCILMEIPWY